MNKISIITTSKNRLEHLKQTLPLMCKQSYCDVIVVDYGCSQGTSEWVSTNFPSIKSIKVKDDPVWSLPRARNIGAKHAKGDWLLFLDADVKIKGDLGAWILENCRSNRYYKVLTGSELSGSFICSSKAYHLIGGYDEAFRGWAGEDLDFYKRLKLNKILFKELSKSFFEPILHDDSERGLDVSLSFDPKIKSRWIYRTYMFQKYKHYDEFEEFPSLKHRKEMWEKIESNAEKLSLSQLKDFPREEKPFKFFSKYLKKTFLYKLYLKYR